MTLPINHYVELKGAPKTIWVAFESDHIRCWVSHEETAKRYAEERGLTFYKFVMEQEGEDERPLHFTNRG